MTAYLSVSVTGCETAEASVTVANFVDFVHIDIRDANGNIIAQRDFDTVPLANGEGQPGFDINSLFPGQLTFTHLPAGQITVEVTETAASGQVSGPEADPSHSASTTIEACPVETTTTVAQTTTTAVAPTTATAAPTTAVATTVAVALPSTPVTPTTAAAQTTAAVSAVTLPVTGLDNGPLVGIGLGFLVVGALAVFTARRRRPAHQH